MVGRGVSGSSLLTISLSFELTAEILVQHQPTFSSLRKNCGTRARDRRRNLELSILDAGPLWMLVMNTYQLSILRLPDSGNADRPFFPAQV